MAKPPITLADLHAAIESLRDEVGELGGELLHRSDQDRRCLRVLLKLSKHIHGQIKTRKKK